ncbi:hypothetical protein LRR18_12220 [Mangrovimonas sp. AS39]|uniref:hypothetical protein n=1 Tax=Mangrovimonas futianensis TaxID=2895523 RepID=UPI001E32841C|nr:hypothetical protein [Mangrovimonas futianensis]MCF1192351.1 hypothetical protein [Mangrovimonas futianensis]MCF1195900.1 hypothetical protein [Mangrovimonas futianensis]
MNKQIIYILLLFTFQTLVGQNKVSYLEKSEEPIDFCGKLKIVEKLIGQKVKIWHDGGIYKTINGTDRIQWPNEELKKIAGKEYWQDFEPKIGDIGEIVHISKSKYDEVFYVLKIDSYYVPILCSYIVSPESLDVKEAEEKRWNEITAYGEGDCNFKKFGINDTWNRAGIAEIDKISESFACELKTNGIDTLMLVKRISDNGSSPYEKEYVLWKENGQGFLKIFENNEKHKPTQTEPKKFDWDDLINFYEENNVSSHTKKPESIISHFTNLIVQFYNGSDFYAFGMQLVCKEEDEKLKKVQFIRQIDNKLK